MSDYPNARDCKHGRLRRSCDSCELEQEIAERDARIRELEAQLIGLADILGVTMDPAAEAIAPWVRLVEAVRRLQVVQAAAQEYLSKLHGCAFQIEMVEQNAAILAAAREVDDAARECGMGGTGQ